MAKLSKRKEKYIDEVISSGCYCPTSVMDIPHDIKLKIDDVCIRLNDKSARTEIRKMLLELPEK